MKISRLNLSVGFGFLQSKILFGTFINFSSFSDLQGQLSRPITESSVLRTAYERHLNRYITNTELCPPLRLKHRWRVCRRLRDRQQNAAEDDYEVGRKGKCHCRIGIAKAPEFLCSVTGFSFRSMVDTSSETTISETARVAGSVSADSSSPSSFRISDLRPLLFPREYLMVFILLNLFAI